ATGGTDGARGPLRAVRHFYAAHAYPSNDAGWDTHYERVIGNVLRHHGSRTDERVRADGVAADDCAVCPQCRAPSHGRRRVLIFPRHVAARGAHVRKDHRRATENVVFKGDTRIERNVVLDLHVIANHDARRDQHVLPDVALAADDGAGHDMREVPDFRAL